VERLGVVGRLTERKRAAQRRLLRLGVDHVERSARVRLEVERPAVAHPVVDVRELLRGGGDVADQVDVDGLGPRRAFVERDRVLAAVAREVAGPNDVRLAALHRLGKRQVEPVLLGVVGPVVDGAAVDELVGVPGEVGAFALAADVGG
jgi:hypothetical protein